MLLYPEFRGLVKRNTTKWAKSKANAKRPEPHRNRGPYSPQSWTERGLLEEGSNGDEVCRDSSPPLRIQRRGGQGAAFPTSRRAPPLPQTPFGRHRRGAAAHHGAGAGPGWVIGSCWCLLLNSLDYWLRKTEISCSVWIVFRWISVPMIFFLKRNCSGNGWIPEFGLLIGPALSKNLVATYNCAVSSALALGAIWQLDPKLQIQFRGCASLPIIERKEKDP